MFSLVFFLEETTSIEKIKVSKSPVVMSSEIYEALRTIFMFMGRIWDETDAFVR